MEMPKRALLLPLRGSSKRKSFKLNQITLQRCALLGLIDAGLGRKEDALREGRRAVELLLVEKDAFSGAFMVTYLGLIAAWVGDKDLAFENSLPPQFRLPGGSLGYSNLKLNPWWDSLRDDPRFEKILEEAKQPVALK